MFDVYAGAQIVERRDSPTIDVVGRAAGKPQSSDEVLAVREAITATAG
ncbi:hypothetical protein [Demequina sp. NBRC 110052]|nr:hypothetical protein [Demequina sp. NBRC 110052]